MPGFARLRAVQEESARQPPAVCFDRAPIACDVARRALSVRLPGQRHYSAAALGRLVAPYVGLADHAAPCAAGNERDPSTPSRRPHYRFSYPVPHRRWPRCRFRRLSLPLFASSAPPPTQDRHTGSDRRRARSTRRCEEISVRNDGTGANRTGPSQPRFGSTDGKRSTRATPSTFHVAIKSQQLTVSPSRDPQRRSACLYSRRTPSDSISRPSLVCRAPRAARRVRLAIFTSPPQRSPRFRDSASNLLHSSHAAAFSSVRSAALPATSYDVFPATPFATSESPSPQRMEPPIRAYRAYGYRKLDG